MAPEQTTETIVMRSINYAESTNILSVTTRRAGLADVCYVDICMLKNALGAKGPTTIDNILRFFPCEIEADIKGNIVNKIAEVNSAQMPPDEFDFDKIPEHSQSDHVSETSDSSESSDSDTDDSDSDISSLSELSQSSSSDDDDDNDKNDDAGSNTSGYEQSDEDKDNKTDEASSHSEAEISEVENVAFNPHIAKNIKQEKVDNDENVTGINKSDADNGKDKSDIGDDTEHVK